MCRLSGKANSTYEQHRFYPQPGDILSIDRLNIVHSAVGCVIADDIFSSYHVVTRPSGSRGLYYEHTRATSVFVFAGRGYLLLGNEAEVRAYSPPVVELQKGDMVTIPNKVYFRFVSEAGAPLCFTRFAVPFEIALRIP